MDIISYILAWSVLLGGVVYALRLLFLEDSSERFARGLYRERNSHF